MSDRDWFEGRTATRTRDWGIGRLGTAAAANTIPGTPPAYGMAFDIASAQGLTADQFNDFARAQAAISQQPIIDLAQRNIPVDQHQRELEIAQNYEKYGLAMENSEFSNTDDDDEGFLTRFGNDLQTGFRQAGNVVGQALMAAPGLVGLQDNEAPEYWEYVAKGGSLTEDEWNSFSPETRNQLNDRASVGRGVQQVGSLPGISQTLYGIQQGFRGLTTFAAMSADVRREAGFSGLFIPKPTTLGMWFDGSKWAANWRATADADSPLSLGNALVNNLVSPNVSQDTLDEWRRHNSWYQMSSVGTEFAVAWHADAGVAAAKLAGNLRRVARNEMPLNESGKMYAAIREAQQGREIISVRTPLAKKYAAWRAERTTEGFNGLVDYAKAVDFGEFSSLPAFHGRTASGVAAAKAIHVAARSGDEKLIELTRGALNGDLRSLRTIQEMKEDPSKAGRFVNGTNFVQAWDSVKLKANQLESEIEKLQKRGVNARSHFARWEIDTDVQLKQAELGEMKAWLEADSDYYDWLASIGTTSVRKSSAVDSNITAVDPYNPQLESYKAPKTKWNDVEERFETVTHRRFMPDIFSTHHTHIKVPPSLLTRRIGVVSMHDLDSGKRGIERFFNQVNSVLDFEDVDDLRAGFNERWVKGENTNHDRYKVMYDMEEEVLIPALAGKLGISEATTRAVFDKINAERKATFEGLSGARKGMTFQSGPTFAERLKDEASSARVVSGADEDGMLTLEFRDGQKLVTAEVHESMLAPRVGPLDVTQTPNYYQPADVRRLYYEMKRHADTLKEVDALTGAGKLAKGVRHSAANLALINDLAATKFYSFWKPLQLWRLGWPQRVLMDEGFRAMAIFGPMYWITGPGAESVSTAARNTPAWVRDKYRAHKQGKVVIADGPLAPKTKADNAFEWQQKAETAVRLPARDFPKINGDRLTHIDRVNTAAGQAIVARDKARAIARETGEVIDPTPFNEAIDGHPLVRALADVHDGTRVYDPVTGRRMSKGYFVPMPNLGHKLTGEWPISENNLLYWYEQNAELLSRRGVRIQVTDSGDIEIGLWFNSKQRRKADEAMKAVARSKPVGEQTAKGLKLDDGSDWELVELDTPDDSTFPELDALDAALANGNLRAVEVAEEGYSAAFEQFDLAINLPPTKKDFGAGRARFRSGGRDYYVDDVFEGHLGRLTRGLTSSAPAMDVLTDAHTAALGMLRHQGSQHTRIQAPAMTGEALKLGTPENKKAVLYFQRYADLMNNQVANSPVWGPMLRGADDATIVRYLTETPKGHAHRREILDQSESVEAYVNEMRAKLDYYLPSNELRRRLAKGPIEPSDLRRKVHNDDLPDIYGPDLTLEDKKFTRALADTVWNALGTIPADKFSRQPFAKAAYHAKVQSLLNQSDAEFLNEAALERIHVMAAEHTREQIRQHLFDLSDGTNLTDALRFIAPFWGAQEEALMKWFKIVSDRPETVARFMVGQRAIYNNLMVLDEENQPVEQNRANGSIFGFGFGYNPSDKMILQIPDVVRKTPFGKALENIGSVGIPIGSANTVLQGEMPLLPSFGPWVTMPADKAMNAWFDTHGTEYAENTMYKWLFPIGRPSGGVKGILEQILPGWGRRAMGAAGAEDDATHANLYMQMAREMTLRNKEKGLPAPTPQQVEDAANLLWGARMMTSFAAPVQVEFRPINQFFSDSAHRYKREYGMNWEEKFFEDFGEEAMAYAISSSSSVAGVPPTTEGILGWAGNKELIAKYPELGGLIVGQDAFLDAFNHDTYEMQFETNLGPGDARTLRDVTDPRERQAKAEESIGWLKFRKIDATVQAELYARGLTNIQQSGAEDISRYRTDQISQLMREYPAWALAWNTSERTIYQQVDALTDVARRPEFDNRVDIQGLRDYLAIRDQVAYQLDLGYANGYSSRNLQAQENAALRNWFYEQVGTLIQSNPAFGEVYSRYLTQDTLMQGSGGYGG